MKSLLAIIIILLITMSSLPTGHIGPQHAPVPKGFTTVAGEHANIQIPVYYDTPADKTGLEEPGGALNQAGNIMLPALKMFQ